MGVASRETHVLLSEGNFSPRIRRRAQIPSTNLNRHLQRISETGCTHRRMRDWELQRDKHAVHVQRLRVGAPQGHGGGLRARNRRGAFARVHNVVCGMKQGKGEIRGVLVRQLRERCDFRRRDSCSPVATSGAAACAVFRSRLRLQIQFGEPVGTSRLQHWCISGLGNSVFDQCSAAIARVLKREMGGTVGAYECIGVIINELDALEHFERVILSDGARILGGAR